MAEQTPVVGKTIGTEKAPEPAKPAEQSGDMVQVVQLRAYMGAEDRREIDDKPYEVTRQRAAELVARGLARYVDGSEGDKQTEADAQKAADAVRQSRGGKETKR